jgi:hypothetical protein
VAVNDQQRRKTVVLAAVLGIFASTGLMSSGFRHLVKLGAEPVFGIQAHTLAYVLLALTLVASALGIAMLVKLIHDSKQRED